MSAKTKVRRVTANDQATVSAPTTGPVRTTGPGWAVWILARFPGVRYRYQAWGTTKRCVVAVLLYLVALPIIPIIVAAVWYSKDPEGFKKSPVMPVLMAVIAAWIGGFGWVANQTPVTDGSPYASVKPQADGEATAVNTDPAATATQASKDKISSQSTSNPTNGRKFENCTAAFDAGVFDIKRNNPSYERRLDRDNDGIACEK
ncbi:MAG: excalibur calcium-binding domain-containing protein [Candidatus Saccharimonas sp.]